MNREERERMGLTRGPRREKPKGWQIIIYGPNLPQPKEVDYTALAYKYNGNVLERIFDSQEDALLWLEHNSKHTNEWLYIVSSARKAKIRSKALKYATIPF